MNIKLFTHTDLDGVGCAILAYLAFGKENVAVEYCNYDDIDLKVSQFFIKGNPGEYDKVFITDISINENLAVAIDRYAKSGLWQLFDHHQTALELNRYDWCNVLVEAADGPGLKTCGTELFGVYLLSSEGLVNRYNWTTINNILQFICIVRDYDTWRWTTLCQMTPELDYVIMIDICNGKVSYRTTRDDLNLGTEIAHSYGGGGHAKAAGSTFDREYISDLVVKKLFETDEMKGAE